EPAEAEEPAGTGPMVEPASGRGTRRGAGGRHRGRYDVRSPTTMGQWEWLLEEKLRPPAGRRFQQFQDQKVCSLVGLESRDLEPALERHCIDADEAELTGGIERHRSGQSGVGGGRIRKYTAAGGAPVVCGVEAQEILNTWVLYTQRSSNNLLPILGRDA
ncbi:hypothetical protein THAOC_10301, partial [Thalassiosira oceanica]